MTSRLRPLLGAAYRQELYPPAALNISGLGIGMMAEGEGVRHGLFVQGCLRYCLGCKNASAAWLMPATMLSPREAALALSRNRVFFFRTASQNATAAYEKALRLNAAVQVLDTLRSGPLFEESISGRPTAIYVKLLRLLRDDFDYASRVTRADDAGQNHTPAAVFGVTISGGEPLLQAPALALMLEELSVLWPDCNLWLYTSVPFARILASREGRRLLELVHVIKHGSFEWRERNLGLYFGSRGQTLLDARASLAREAPVAFAMSEPAVGIELSLNEQLRRARDLALAPCVLDLWEERWRSGAPPPPLIEDIEALLGPIDSSLHERLFVVRERRRLRGYAFLGPRQVNTHHVGSGALVTLEGPTAEVWLQGTRHAPPTHVSPRYALQSPKHIQNVGEVLDEATRSPWYLRTSLMEPEALMAFVRLCLEHRALRLQTRYRLTRSPLPELSLREYVERAERLLMWQEGLFTKDLAGFALHPRSLAIRGGDPALQVSGVIALAEEAHARGLEVWAELPCPWSAVQSHSGYRRIAAASDYAICGRQACRRPPPLHPFLSSQEQRVHDCKTGALWAPRFAWSLPIRDHVLEFSDERKLASMCLPELSRPTVLTDPPPLSLEDYLAWLASARRDCADFEE